jgi:hypothetical protein
MAGYYLVIKNIYGNRYYYYQRTWREGKKVKCHCIYVGRADSGIRPASRATFNPQPKNLTPAEELAEKINRAQTPYEVARLSRAARLASSSNPSMNAGMNDEPLFTPTGKLTSPESRKRWEELQDEEQERWAKKYPGDPAAEGRAADIRDYNEATKKQCIGDPPAEGRAALMRDRGGSTISDGAVSGISA